MPIFNLQSFYPMQTWKTRARQTILDHSKYLTVEQHEVELPTGQVISDWPWVVTPDFINVVALTEDGEFICFRQTKYAVDGVSLAIVGGYLEPNEDPLATAQRELREETGYEANDWLSLGRYAVDGNRGSGMAHLFLASNGRYVGHVESDDLEEQEMCLLSRQEVQQALRDGEFKVLPWATAVALALFHLDQQ